MDYRKNITGTILAGGEGKRLQGQNKGLLTLMNKPLISYAIDKLSKQTGQIIINANKDVTTYEKYGYQIISDNIYSQCGPLSGIVNCMKYVQTEFMLCIPCDSPFLPDNLTKRLYLTMQKNDSDICMAHNGQRSYPVCALIKTGLLESLLLYLNKGERKVDKWYEQHRLSIVKFTDNSQAFLNINTQEDIIYASGLLAAK